MIEKCASTLGHKRITLHDFVTGTINPGSHLYSYLCVHFSASHIPLVPRRRISWGSRPPGYAVFVASAGVEETATVAAVP